VVVCWSAASSCRHRPYALLTLSPAGRYRGCHFPPLTTCSAGDNGAPKVRSIRTRMATCCPRFRSQGIRVVDAMREGGPETPRPEALMISARRQKRLDDAAALISNSFTQGRASQKGLRIDGACEFRVDCCPPARSYKSRRPCSVGWAAESEVFPISPLQP